MSRGTGGETQFHVQLLSIDPLSSPSSRQSHDTVPSRPLFTRQSEKADELENHPLLSCRTAPADRETHRACRGADRESRRYKMAEDSQQKTTADLKLVNCNEATTMCPADIYYITGREDDVNHNSATASLLDEDNVLQVVEKGGVFFTLDNARLGEMKRLYRQGKCPRVRVKQIPLASLPQSTRDMMLLPVPRKQKGRLHGKGPLKLLSFLHLDRRSSLPGARSTDEETTDEDTDRSDSECDWIATESK